MNVKYMRDLHLEFGTPEKVYKDLEGDILILAGDIIDAKHRGLDILKFISSNFNHVIMVLGNHEFYHGKYTLVYDKLKAVLPDNVYLLENENIEIDGINFIGCTLWSYMNEVDCYFAKLRMNDYKCVRSGPKNEPWLRKLSPTETVSAHLHSARYLEENITENSVVITHHAPSFKSCNPDYEGNTAYATDLSDMMFDLKPAYWIHGHLHDTQDYFIGETNILANPYGYYAHGTNPHFEMGKSFTV